MCPVSLTGHWGSGRFHLSDTAFIRTYDIARFNLALYFVWLAQWSVDSMSAFNRPVRRALTSEERALLEWLIANGNPDAKQYAPQLAGTKVVGLCTCGCPTLDLAIGDRKERTIGSSHVLAEFDGSTAEGVQVRVILDAREEQISELEVIAIADFEGVFNLPLIASLRR